MYHALFVDTDVTELNVKLNEGYTIQNEYTVGGRTLFILRNRELERNRDRIVATLATGGLNHLEVNLGAPEMEGQALQWQYTAPPRG